MRVALYERVSSEEQERHGLSLDEQSRALTQYAKEHEMQIVDEYIDGGISARKRYTKRPALCRLLDDIRADKIDMVLFIKLDRWFRNVADYYEVQKILDDHNVKWQATEEDYETVTASGRFKVNIMLSVAQDEADRTSERIKFIHRGKRERNEPVCGAVPLGYKIEGKHVVKDEAVAPYIDKTFRVYMETGSPTEVFNAVPELRLDYRRLSRILTNPAYKGEYSQIHIPQYVTPAEWDKIQEMRPKVVRKAKHNRYYLFSGLLRCPVCGNRLAGCYTGPHDNEYFYYRCMHAHLRLDCDFTKSPNQNYIERYLLEHIESKVQIVVKTKPKEVSHQKERDSIQKKLTRLSELYVNGLIEIADYKRQYDRLRDDLDAVPPDKPAPDTDKLQERFFPNWQAMYNELPPQGKQSFWRACIDTVEFNTDGTIRDFSLSTH